ncbi:MAG: hypothetical protein WCK47_11340 [bacterium]|nr:hypothetical protein [Candidatus Sumerlaeota bacterium]
MSAMTDAVTALQPGIKRMLVLGGAAAFPASAAPGADVVCDPFEYESNGRRTEPLSLRWEDGEFSFVAVCGILDRLAAAEREPFLREAVRVTSRCLMVISPFESPLASSAEESVNEIHKTARGCSHPAIALHRRQGLPALDKARLAVASFMGAAPHVFPCTSLRSWALFEMLACVAGIFERGETLFSRLNRFYNTRLARLDHGLPVYRHILLAAKPGKPLKPQALRALEQRYNADPAAAEGEIQTVRELLRLVLDSIHETLAAPPAEKVFTRALERALELEQRAQAQSAIIEKLNKEIYILKNPRQARNTSSLLKRFFTF